MYNFVGTLDFRLNARVPVDEAEQRRCMRLLVVGAVRSCHMLLL